MEHCLTPGNYPTPGRGTRPLPVAIGTGGKFHTGTILPGKTDAVDRAEFPRPCHCEERSDAAIRIPSGCDAERRKRERIPTSACGLLGMTGLGNGALFDARQLSHTGGGTPPLPVAIGTGGKSYIGRVWNPPLRGWCWCGGSRTTGRGTRPLLSIITPNTTPLHSDSPPSPQKSPGTHCGCRGKTFLRRIAGAGLTGCKPPRSPRAWRRRTGGP